MTGSLKQRTLQYNKSTEDGHKSGVPGKTGVPDFFMVIFQIQFVHLCKYDKIN